MTNQLIHPLLAQTTLQKIATPDYPMLTYPSVCFFLHEWEVQAAGKIGICCFHHQMTSTFFCHQYHHAMILSLAISKKNSNVPWRVLEAGV
jgi:hypothetical protein